MQEGLGDKSQLASLFFRLFSLPEKRRLILCHWHAKKAKLEHESLADDFRLFIQTILYEPLCFHLLSDHFTVFGPSLPIRYTWIQDDADRRVFFHMFKNRKQMFVNQKELNNNQFDYSSLVCLKDSELMDVVTKRQMVRDFVWICCERNEPYIILALIKAIQTILAHARGKGDLFLGALHQALQGKIDVYEVVCDI
jgi:hypothetical protein